MAAVWPASGYVLALLLLMPAYPRARVSAFAGMILSSLAANIWSGVPLASCFAYSFANGCEAAVALWLIRRREPGERSEEHTSELQSLMRISYAVFCLKKKNKTKITTRNNIL